MRHFELTDKQELRRIARQRRRNFVASLDSLAHRLAFKALPSPLLAMLEPCHMVALYMPVGDEAPATRLAAALTTAGKSLCLPQVKIGRAHV